MKEDIRDICEQIREAVNVEELKEPCKKLAALFIDPNEIKDYSSLSPNLFEQAIEAADVSGEEELCELAQSLDPERQIGFFDTFTASITELKPDNRRMRHLYIFYPHLLSLCAGRDRELAVSAYKLSEFFAGSVRIRDHSVYGTHILNMADSEILEIHKAGIQKIATFFFRDLSKTAYSQSNFDERLARLCGIKVAAEIRAAGSKSISLQKFLHEKRLYRNNQDAYTGFLYVCFTPEILEALRRLPEITRTEQLPNGEGCTINDILADYRKLAPDGPKAISRCHATLMRAIFEKILSGGENPGPNLRDRGNR